MNNNIIYPTQVPEYIGLKIENGEYQFIFPCNYQKATTEEELRKDILNILYAVEKYKNQANINDSHQQHHTTPLNIYIWILKNYLEYGYYQTTKTNYTKNTKGKINWSKTIKNNRLFPHQENIIYKDFIVKKNETNRESPLTMIHKFCVYEAASKLGWLYNLNVNTLEKPSFIFPTKESMLTFLKTEYTRSFKDTKKELILNMIKMLEGLDLNQLNTKNYDLSTNEFEYVFETLIEESFSTTNSKDYNPSATWHLKTETFPASELRPDTILIKDNIAYVIDAKYYQYGYTKQKNDLPVITSIHKQITYAEDLELQHQEINKIYNIFLLPTASTNSYLEYIGNADTSWKDGNKTYEKVYAFLIDLKSLINKNYTKEENINILIEKLNKELPKE